LSPGILECAMKINELNASRFGCRHAKEEPVWANPSEAGRSGWSEEHSRRSVW
jgi:hypothetical protein